MTSEEIKSIIKTEVLSEADIENDFSSEFEKHLIESIKQQYKDSNDAKETYELWTVFEEREDKNGYKIFFDEKVKEFGLAIQSDTDALIKIGHYGSFIKALYSM
jgi:hypothetical protein